ncbi:MAG TPA: hypothetical protein VFH72_02020 [Candidatus Baltobacteraceae bacterium]|nr:hypothetical protein [Candidatus Baltobacteraceae bacterium]
MTASSDGYIPPDDTRLWRYMKLNSFLELLSGHLIQTRIDVLNDAAEGAFGYKQIRLCGAADTVQGIREARTRVAATYWFEFEERESYGMWNVYGRTGESVAIETTVGALRDVLEREGQVRIERMRYEPMRGDIDDIATLFFHKRREYKEEREIRSVQVFDKPLKDSIVDQRLSLDDLNTLVRRIILAPDSRQTFIDAVKHIVESVFAFNGKRFAGEICGSALDEDLVPQE